MNFVSNRLVSHETNKVFEGVQHVYTFKNGYGASVVKHKFSYGGNKGRWELALMKDGELFYNGDFPDVVGHLLDPDVDRWLKHISLYE